VFFRRAAAADARRGCLGLIRNDRVWLVAVAGVAMVGVEPRQVVDSESNSAGMTA